MLTQDTKKHIDAARQILVGVVPNPMSQVEQITNALIYKFMDDMDQQAIKAGGDPFFFVKDLEKYAWTKVMDSRLGNQERMNLYTEALMKFSEAKQLPQLFRDIFKQAFLPYRDPEVLGLFLKEISYFDYTHSEELGNAYEYLLSIMSSQGDAGQFRTPRHIIDFIVDVLAPTKDDTILDPACGTAGFLISAYNYIKRQNEGVDPETGKMRQLTADERRKLVNNFEGYDVDPTMVRMSQVNMYLHKFTTPKIYNYNTLASEDRWNDKFDLILANPPFMSPKGGIKPHNKFSVQANRAEVLFVDYIMNHLKPKGRAGIIVPEGIIFQSGKAYKELRKNLVNDGLFAVVSLPAGVFNPYSGVKTSILFFDNEVAKKTKDLLFVKVTSDGYDLGAQRRKIEKDDLGDTGVILKGFREYVRTDQDQETIESFISGSGKGFIVSKEKIAETGDYNLSADRYKATKAYTEAKYPLVKIGDIVEVLDNLRRPITKSDRKEGIYPYYGATGILDYVESFIFDERLVLIGEDGAKWNTGDKTAFIAEGKYWVNNHAHVVRPVKEKLIDVYLVSVLNQMDLSPYITGVTVPKLNQEKLRSIEIPLPPLEVQKEIVEQIEVKQKAIEGAKQVIENLERERRYFGQSLRKLENITMTGLKDICKNLDSKRKPVTKSDRSSGKYPYYGASGIVDFVDEYIFDGEYLLVSEDGANLLARSTPIAFSISGKTWVNNHAHILEFENKNTQKFTEFYLNSIDLREYITGSAQPKLNQENLNKIEIPLPTLEVQEQMVEEIESEKKIIESNEKLIEIMEKKIEEVLSEI